MQHTRMDGQNGNTRNADKETRCNKHVKDEIIFHSLFIRYRNRNTSNFKCNEKIVLGRNLNKRVNEKKIITTIIHYDDPETRDSKVDKIGKRDFILDFFS